MNETTHEAHEAHDETTETTPVLTKWQPRDMHEATQRAELRALFGEISRLMPDWTIQPDANNGEDSNYRNYILAKGDLAFHITRDQSGKRDKINVSTWNWPKYRTIERGDTRDNTVFPNSLYDPKESSPSIQCSVSRGAVAIVKDIKRRFLPDYERIYARCLAKAQQSQQYADETKAGWAAVCKVIRQDPARESHHIKTALGDYSFSVSNRSSKAHVEFDCTAAQLAKVLEVLK